MKRLFFLLLVCPCAAHLLAQTSKPILEHIFDGYYYPYNMAIYNPSQEDDSYFYPELLNITDGHINAAIYNEDYTVRQSIDCTIDIPEGYKISSVEISGNMILPDGTEFFIVNFTKESWEQHGYADYSISKAYSCEAGNPLLFDIASATSSLSCLPMYVINGKVSLVVIARDYDNSTRQYSYKTYIFSLGECPSDSEQILTDRNTPYTIRTYDMNGRLVDMESKGRPVIVQYSDGSAMKIVR